jgi:hypothetical protein
VAWGRRLSEGCQWTTDGEKLEMVNMNNYLEGLCIKGKQRSSLRAAGELRSLCLLFSGFVFVGELGVKIAYLFYFTYLIFCSAEH